MLIFAPENSAAISADFLRERMFCSDWEWALAALVWFEDPRYTMLPRGSTADTTSTFGLEELDPVGDTEDRIEELVGDADDLLEDELHEELPSEPRPSGIFRLGLSCQCGWWE